MSFHKHCVRITGFNHSLFQETSTIVDYGIDPLLSYLDERLQGISIYKTPTLGPTLPRAAPLPSLEEKYKLIAYVDDVKPAITSMNEFLLVDRASLLFENASGCELHRDPASGKVKFLPLGR